MKNIFLHAGLIAILISGCSSGPEQIKFNFDSCSYCEMVISDPRFPAQIITTTGKIYKFDAVECMIGAVEENEIPKEKIEKMFITDFAHNDSWLEVNTTYFMICSAIKSPMGVNAKAFATKTDAENAASENNGKVYDWNSLKGFVIETWM